MCLRPIKEVANSSEILGVAKFTMTKGVNNQNIYTVLLCCRLRSKM